MFPDRSSRLQSVQDRANQPSACPVCGGSWFIEATFNQYSGGIYSSAAGGDLQVISTMPQSIRICLCGEPISPNIGGVRGGRTSNGEMASFHASLEAAQKVRASLFDSIKDMGEQVASRESVEALEKQLADLREQVNAVMALATAPGLGAQDDLAPVTAGHPLPEVTAEGAPKKRRGQ